MDYVITTTGGSISAGDGDNNISITSAAGGSNTVITGAGNDSIQVEDRDETEEQRYSNRLDAGEGNNYIYNSDVERSTISAGTGNDTIITGGGEYYSSSRIASIVAGAGDNQISVNSYTTYGEIYAGGGNDYVSVVSGSNNIISVSGGDDSVVVGMSNSTINVGVGNNFVTLNADSSKNNIVAGNGDDFVSMASSANNNNLLIGGGNNTVYGAGNNHSILANDGDNLISVGSGGYISVGNGKNDISIIVTSGGTTVVAGNGDDSINASEEPSNVKYENRINAGEGNNYINNGTVERSTISAGAGNDTIITGGGDGYYSGSRNASIVAGAGDNQITVNSYMTEGEIYAGNGNDYVSVVSGSQNIISVSGGDDSVVVGMSNSTINVGVGNNFVTLKADSSKNNIVAGNGDDFVSMASSANNNNLLIGGGNNTVYGAGNNHSILANDGDNLISVGSGGYISVGNGKNDISIIVTSGGTTVVAGNGDDSINASEEPSNVKYYNNINAGEGNNYINNGTVELSTISAGTGNDTIITGGGNHYYNNEYTSIVAGAGDNQISVNSNMTYGRIYAGGGSDLVSILGDGGNNIISVGDGRNTIITNNHYDYTYNAENTIEAGTGSDLIYTIAQNSFINAGSGRNYISLGSSADNTIVTGKGDDTITFGANSGNNVIIFGEGKDIVYNFASGDTIGVAGSLTQSTVSSDIILTDGTSYMTLKGAAGKDISIATLSSNDNVYKILAADNTVGDTVLPSGLNDTTPPDTTPPDTTPADTTPPDTTPASKFITLTEDADDYDNTVEGATIAALGGDDSIYNSDTNVSISGGAGKDYIWNDSYASLTVIDGGDGDDTIRNNGTKVSISGGADNDSIWNSSYASLTVIDGGGGNDEIYNNAVNVTIEGGSGDDSINNLETNVSISGGAGKDYIWNSSYASLTVIDSGDGDDTIRNNGTNVTIKGGAGDDYINNNVENVSINGGAGNDSIYNSSDSVTVNVSEGDDTISISGYITNLNVEGFGAGDVIELAGEIDNLGTINGGVTAGDVTIKGLTAQNSTTVWSINNNVATYTAKNSVGAALSDDKKSIVYKAASEENLVTVSGVKSTVGLAIDGDTITVADSALNQTDVTVSDGYELKLGDDVTKSSTTAAGWTVDDNYNATYKTESTTAGYSINNNQISYTPASGGTTLAELSGIATSSTPTLDSNTISIAANNFAGKEVSIVNGGDYAFELTAENYSGKIFNGNVSDDKIINKGSNIELSGGAGADSFVNSGENVTFKYNAGDGNDVITGFNADDKLSIAGASYSSATNDNDIVITVDDGSITLKDAASLTAINIDGTLKSDVSIPADALEYNGHKYYLYSDEGLAWEEARIYCEARGGHLVTITDADEQAAVQNLVKEKGTKNSYWMGGFKDKVTKNSKWITDEEFNYANWGWNQPDGDGNALMMYRSTKNGWPLGTWNDLNADGTCGTQKFFGLQNMGFICEWEEAPVTIIEPTLSAETLVLDNNTTTPAIFGEDTEVADATRRKKPVSIVGNDLANSIVGGEGNDTLDGAGDDDTLTGGKGNDLFIYNGGDDLITDYNSKDKISVAADPQDFEINGTDLIFDFGNNDSLTIADGASIAVNINSTINYYTEDGIMNGKQKSINLSEDLEESFDASKAKLYSKLVTIDGSATNAIEIVGNKKANYIIASGKGATLNGGKGNDTLRGGAGEDVFVYEKNSGRDVITIYGNSDVISLGSGATIKDAYMKKNDAVIKIGNGSITVKNILDKEITFAQGDNETIFINGVFIDEDNSTAQVYGSFKGAIDLSKYDMTTADATLSKKSVTLQGSTSTDSLLGGKGKNSILGGDEDDTLNGGKGNDSLWGGNGADNFVYQAGDGTDYIMDYNYDDGDMLTILNKKGKIGDFKKAEFSKDTLTLLIVGGGKVSFKNVAESTAFNINDKTYHVRGNTIR